MSVESDIAIDVRGLTKSFGAKKVVNNFTLQVARGIIQGFLGPNGSGKTTTIRMLCGLLTPELGRGKMSWLRHPPPAERDQALCRLHDAGLFALSRPYYSPKS